MKSQVTALMVLTATILTVLVTQIVAMAFTHEECKSVPLQEATVTCWLEAQERKAQGIDTGAITEALNATVVKTAQEQVK